MVLAQRRDESCDKPEIHSCSEQRGDQKYPRHQGECAVDSYGGFDIPWDQYSDACKALGNDACRELSGRTGHIRSSAIQKADEYSKKVESESAEIRTKYGDIGSYAAALGYDAINAEGHGESGSYTVILNRTKTIMLDDSDRSDEEDSGLITFRPGRNGKLDAIRNGKVIGWVAVSESGDI